MPMVQLGENYLTDVMLMSATIVQEIMLPH